MNDKEEPCGVTDLIIHPGTIQLWWRKTGVRKEPSRRSTEVLSRGRGLPLRPPAPGRRN